MIGKQIPPLKNRVQKYSWGSLTAIPELLGKPPSGEPQAELWMGAHPKAPSTVMLNGERIPLDQAIERFPEAILGTRVAGAFEGRLPFLFKFLAAAAPLSVQAHPDRRQAAAGFLAENRAGIPLDAPHRNYRDPNHKPECICALKPFWGLCGFRAVSESAALLEALCPRTLRSEVDRLREGPPEEALRDLYQYLLTCSPGRRREVLGEAMENVRRRRDESPVFHWIAALHRIYPDDITVISPVLLNLFCLAPGEALFLPAGELHAYLDGVGVEVMANSDNVLRGGLTPKHIDVAALMKILRTEPRPLAPLIPEMVSDHEGVYRTAAREFLLSMVTVKEGAGEIPMASGGVEILLCTQGDVRIRGDADPQAMAMPKGTSVLVPGSVEGYRLWGRGTLYRVSVPR